MKTPFNRLVAAAIVASVALVGASSNAHAAVITFDEGGPAPALFSEAEPLTDQFMAQGVLFSGRGAVLNLFLSDFLGYGMADPANNIVGYSGETPIGPIPPPDDEQTLSKPFDELTLSTPSNGVSFLVAPSLMNIGSMFDARAFDASNMLLDSKLLELVEGFQQVSLAGMGIARVQFGVTGDDFAEFAIDNLNLQADGSVPEPLTLTLFGAALAAAGLVRARRGPRA